MRKSVCITDGFSQFSSCEVHSEELWGVLGSSSELHPCIARHRLALQWLSLIRHMNMREAYPKKKWSYLSKAAEISGKEIPWKT